MHGKHGFTFRRHIANILAVQCPHPGLERSDDVEQSVGGPLGTLIAGLGMGAYYIGLTWINVLLGILLTPFFLIPLTWVQDALANRKS